MKDSPPTPPPLATDAAANTKKHDRPVVADGIYMPPAKRRALQQAAAAVAAPVNNNNNNNQSGSRSTVTTDAGALDVVPTTTTNGAIETHSNNNNNNNNEPANSLSIQKETWEVQRRIVLGTINRLNAATLKPLIHDLFATVDLLRLRGVLAKSILAAATSSISFSAVYAALVAVLTAKLPELGELVVHRAILALRRHYQRRDKAACTAMVLFLGHLFHQAVVHELLLLQILTLLLDETTLTDDSVEVAIALLTLTGAALLEKTPTGVRAVLDQLRALLHQGTAVDPRVAYKLEQLLALRKTGFVTPSASTSSSTGHIPPELDLVEVQDQITFDEVSLDDDHLQKHAELDVFHFDPDYAEQEHQWSQIRAEILGLDDDDDDETDDEEDGTTDDDDDNNQEGEESTTAIVPISSSNNNAIQIIQDLSEADLVHLRRTIYLTIMSSATFEECAHKLAKIEIPPGREEELINMLIECCSQERTFLRYYGLIAARFCQMDRHRWLNAFMEAFSRQYSTIHRLETNKLRNVAKLFAHLIHTDSVPWSVLSIIHLNEDETTSSSRIFIKILVQEMAEAVGIAHLKERFGTTDEVMSEWYKGMFPKDNVRNTRYAINFFTTIGLGPLTDDLREYLKNAPKLILAQAQQTALAATIAAKEKADESSSSSESSSSTSDSSSLSSSSSSSSSSSYSSDSSSSYDSRRRSRRRRSSSRDRRQRRRRDRSVSSSSSSSATSDDPSSARRQSRREKNKSRESTSRRGNKDSEKRSTSRKIGGDGDTSRSKLPSSRRHDERRR